MNFAVPRKVTNIAMLTMSKNTTNSEEISLLEKVALDMRNREAMGVVLENNFMLAATNKLSFLTARYFKASWEEKVLIEGEMKTIQQTIDDTMFLSTDRYDQMSKDMYVAVEGLTYFASRDRSHVLIQGYCDKIKQLIGQGADIDQKCKNNFTPLLAAAFAGNADLMQFLIDAKANVEDSTDLDQNILHMAAQSGDAMAIICALKARRMKKEEGGEVVKDLCVEGDKKGNAALNYIVLNYDFNINALELMVVEESLLKLNQAKIEGKEVSLHSIFRLKAVAGGLGNKRAVKAIDDQILNSSKLGSKLELGLNIYKITNLCAIRDSRKEMTALERELMQQSIDDSVQDTFEYCVSGGTKHSSSQSLSFVLDVMCGVMEEVSVSKRDEAEYVYTMQTMMSLALKLIEAGADVNAKSKGGYFTALHLASYFNFSQTVKCLIVDHGASTKEVTSGGETILHLSALKKDPKTIDVIHRLDPSLINQKNFNGNTPLHLSAHNGFLGVVKNLIDKGADRGAVNNAGDTALHLAASSGAVKGFSKIIKTLSQLPNEHFLHALNAKGQTALHYAAASGSAAAAQALLDAGADREMLNKERQNVFQCAVGEARLVLAPTAEDSRRQEQEEVARVIACKLGALQQDAISKAFKAKARQAEEVLLDAMEKPEFDANAVLSDNWRPLHIAAKFGQVDIVSALMEKGADMDVKADGNLSVLRCAIDSRNLQMMKRVLKNSHLAFEDVMTEVGNVMRGDIAHNMFLEVLNDRGIIDHFKAINHEEKERFLTFYDAMPPKIKGGENGKMIQKFAHAINDVKEPAGLSKKERQAKYLERMAKEEEERNGKEEKESVEKGNVAEDSRNEHILVEKKVGEERLFDERVVEETLVDERVEQVNSQESISDITMEDMSTLESVDCEASKLSASAKEFVPKQPLSLSSDEWSGLGKVFLLDEKRQQMKDYLADSKETKAVSDLPEFLRPSINSLLNKGYLVFIKGSKVPEKKPFCSEDRRVPVDLDIEVVGRGFISKDFILETGEVMVEKSTMLEKKNHEAKKLLADHFKVEQGSERIFRGFSVPDFVVNAKDETGLIDISLYDLDSPSRFSWIHSREQKIKFNNHDKTAKCVTPIGLKNYVQGRCNAGMAVQEGFYINPDVKGLTLRLSFLESVGRISADELSSVRLPAHPLDLLFQDVKMYKNIYDSSVDKNAYVKSELGKFMEAHQLEDRHQLRFLSNLSNMVNSGFMYHKQRPSQEYAPLQSAIEEMKVELEEAQLKPAASPMSSKKVVQLKRVASLAKHY